jgi:hypothetical protein
MNFATPSLLKRLARVVRCDDGRAVRSNGRRSGIRGCEFRPRLESLEDRTMMSVGPAWMPGQAAAGLLAQTSVASLPASPTAGNQPTTGGVPNLTPYRPSTWSDKIVVSKTTGNNTDSGSLTANDSLYIDWAAANLGSQTAGGTFSTYLYVDGVYKQTWTATALAANTYCYAADYSLGRLGAGTHAIKIVVDGAGVVAESNESDNVYTKSITVSQSSASTPNLTPYQPSGWSDKIVVSKSTGTNTDSGSLTTNDSLYIDWAAANFGNQTAGGTFSTYLYVDGTYKQTWSTTALAANTYCYVSDYSLGRLTAGTHTIKVVVDAAGNVAESNELDNVCTKTITVSQTSSTSSYMLTSNWGGQWYDAEKSPSNNEDDELCWAAAASNVLAWSGWGQVGGMTNADQMFRYFQDHWTDQGSLASYAWDWWFDGTNNMQNSSGWAQVDVRGGGFYTGYSFGNYFRANTTPSQAMAAIDQDLHAGCGVSLGIYGPGSHAITVWGYAYTSGSPTSYRGVYITDSDDDKGSSNPQDQLRYYDVAYSGGNWYLQNYYGTNDWYIGAVFGLARRSAGQTGSASADSRQQPPSTGMADARMTTASCSAQAVAANCGETDQDSTRKFRLNRAAVAQVFAESALHG